MKHQTSLHVCPLPSLSAVSLKIGKLKLMLERLLRVKAAQQALLLVPPEGCACQVRLPGWA